MFQWVGLLALIEVAVCNIHWVEYRFLGGARVAFTVSPFMAVIIVAVLTAAAFREELEAQFYRLDGKLFGKTEQYIPPQAAIRYERLFTWAALGFGLLFVFLIPPMTAPDETNHFIRALLLANGQMLPAVDRSGKAVGKVAADLPAFISHWNAARSAPGSLVNLQTLSGLFRTSVSSGAPAATVDYPYPYLSFFLYLPQAAGILFGRFLFALLHAQAHYNMYSQLIFARLANLACYIAMVALAIRMMPFFRRTLAFIVLMPMAVYIAASCSYDVFLYASCLLYLACVLRYAYDPTVTEITGKQLAVLVVLQFCILLAKYVYFPLMFLIFLIPQAKFQGRPKRKILLMTAVPSVVCLAAWLIAYKIAMTHAAADPYGTVYVAQANYILAHPARYAAMLLSNLYDYRQEWLTGFVGLFGWLNAPLPFPFAVAYLALLGVSSLLELVVNRTFLSGRILAGVAVACYILVASAEYVVWTPSLGDGTVGQSNIIGIQGRYFIPFALPILLLLANKWSYRTYLVGKMDTALHKVSFLIVLGCLGFATYYLLRFYWLPA